MHNTYKETLTVWPVNDATGLHLFSTPEAAETYADEHQGDMLEPMPVMSARTVWHCVGLRFIGRTFDWNTYTVEELGYSTKERPATATRPSVRAIPLNCEDFVLEVCAETEEKTHELAAFLGDSVVRWVAKEGKQKPSLSHRLELALKNYVEGRV